MSDIRQTASYSADHASMAAAAVGLSAQAADIQTVASLATRMATFLGLADALALDNDIFDSIVSSMAMPRSPSLRRPIGEQDSGLAPSGFQGQQFVAPAPPASKAAPAGIDYCESDPYSDCACASADGDTCPADNSSGSQTPGRGSAESEMFVDGFLQVSAVKLPAKPFYIGLVDVPGIGYANTLFSRNESGEFDPTRVASNILMAQPLVRHWYALNGHSITPAVVRLNVNPTDITLTYSKKVTATRVRASYQRGELPSGGKVTGHVVQHHWDELDTVSVNCVTGNFWVNGGLDYPRGEAGFHSGSSPSRTTSLAYRKLQAVVAMFRNNGCAWITGGTKLSSQEEQKFFGTDFGVIVNPGSAFMMYDNIIWYGHFQNMSVIESSDMLHAFEFSIEFQVAKTIDLNGVSDQDVMLATNTPSFFSESQPPPGISAQRPGVESAEQSKPSAEDEAESRGRVDKMLTPAPPPPSRESRGSEASGMLEMR